MCARKMFYGAVVSVFENAKELRENMTEAEIKLWSRIHNKQLGFRFKPQHPISRFIADFYCHKAKLIIEVDGGQHAAQSAADAERTCVLQANGYRVLRYWNNDILNREAIVFEVNASVVDEVGWGFLEDAERVIHELEPTVH